ELAKRQRKKELLRFLCLLLLSNFSTYLLSYEAPQIVAASNIVQAIPNGHEKIRINADLLVPFSPEKSVKVLGKKNELVCNKVILFSQEISSAEEDFLNQNDQKSLTVLTPIECLSKILGTKNLKLVPLTYQEKFIA